MITDEELGAILSVRSYDEVGSRNRAALLLMANMGLRCCEVVALTLDDVDFRNGTVNVTAAKCQDARTLPLEAGAGAALADYICHHRPGSTSRAVFLRNKSHRGDPMSLPQMRNSLRYQARLAGVGDFGTHMLRRRAATSMVAAGTPMKVVADVLGHAEVQTTTAYLRIDVEGLRAVAAEWPGDGRG
jgi:site-specific recombinase XerD